MSKIFGRKVGKKKGLSVEQNKELSSKVLDDHCKMHPEGEKSK